MSQHYFKNWSPEGGGCHHPMVADGAGLVSLREILREVREM